MSEDRSCNPGEMDICDVGEQTRFDLELLSFDFGPRKNLFLFIERFS
jgi:hypothetical protein